MKRLLISTLLIGLSLTSGLYAQAQQADLAKRQCRSTHLWWSTNEKLKEPVELFYNEMTIEKSADGSYFMANGFSGGYFGLQELYDGKKIAIFSVWEPGNPHDYQADQRKVKEEDRVKVLGSGEGVQVKRFGGEGTGAQSKLPFNWELGKTYKFIVTAKPATKPEGTIFSGYLFMPETKEWKLMATFQTKVKAKHVRGAYSFVEDFRRNYESAKKVRKAHYGNTWFRTQEGKWHPAAKARFTADGTPSNAINAGSSDKYGIGYFMQTGGDTKMEQKLYQRVSNANVNEEMLKKLSPPKEAVDFKPVAQ
eukprot:Seg14887.1 transcript_id=Seg14887.1/GoldUCD/mRNA.D3Y31 product="hypothetical protein" protein_id=Seg14887.1/GoldUCD/D3Y31